MNIDDFREKAVWAMTEYMAELSDQCRECEQHIENGDDGNWEKMKEAIWNAWYKLSQSLDDVALENER